VRCPCLGNARQPARQRKPLKTRAEDTIIVASVRIGEEIKKVPKATPPGPGRGKKTK
jgi:hypothetical protein